VVEIDLRKFLQVVLGVCGDQEGCVALDLWCAVNFVHGAC